jgi:hypothetical protein
VTYRAESTNSPGPVAGAGERERQPAATVVCGVCGELIPPGHYWERAAPTEGRRAGWLLRHRKANGKWCKNFAGDAEIVALLPEVAPEWWDEAKGLIVAR